MIVPSTMSSDTKEYRGFPRMMVQNSVIYEGYSGQQIRCASKSLCFISELRFVYSRTKIIGEHEMSTKPPPLVQEFSAESLEKVAYSSVNSIPTLEPNDKARLGYHIWRWLLSKQGTLEQAIAESGSRLTVSKEDASKIISQSLDQQGIKFK